MTVFILLNISAQAIMAEQQKKATEKKTPEYVRPVYTDIDKRLKKIERVLQSQGLFDMLQLIEDLQDQHNKLRGEIEVQKNDLVILKEKQKNLYKDIDQRLRLLGEKSATARTGTQAEVQHTIPTANHTDQDEGTKKVDKIDGEIKTVTTAKKADEKTIEMEYQRAFQLLRQAKYTQATQEFTLFLNAYPDSDYADNAQYWLAEAYYVVQKYQKALSEYEKLLARYPGSPKAAHALLKIAYSYHELGNTDEAKKRLADLIKAYPNTTAAHLAKDRLQKINTVP